MNTLNFWDVNKVAKTLSFFVVITVLANTASFLVRSSPIALNKLAPLTELSHFMTKQDNYHKGMMFIIKM